MHMHQMLFRHDDFSYSYIVVVSSVFVFVAISKSLLFSLLFVVVAKLRDLWDRVSGSLAKIYYRKNIAVLVMPSLDAFVGNMYNHGALW